MDTDLEVLTERMQRLLDDREETQRLGEGARRDACQRFAITRFLQEGGRAFAEVLKPAGHARR